MKQPKQPTLVLLLFILIFANACQTVKEYQKNRLNDAEMALSTRKVEKNEISK